MPLSAQYVSDDIVLNAGIRCSCAVLRQIRASALSPDVELMKAEAQPCRPVRLSVCWFVEPLSVLGCDLGDVMGILRCDCNECNVKSS